MQYEAVVFDLFGTLVHQFSLKSYQEVVRQMALALGASPQDFTKAWFETGRQRSGGGFQHIKDSIRSIVEERLCLSVDEDKIAGAAKIRLDYVRQLLTPLPYALDTLIKLRAQNLKVGLVSNCSIDVPEVWDETPFGPLLDAIIFSCLVGLSKPDPRIYEMACQKMGIPAVKCLYVGDGSSQELTGALKAGMYPVLIRNLDYDTSEEMQTDSEVETWKGPVINSLSQVMDLIK